MAENILVLKNTQTSAPVLSGTAGAGIALLTAVLVNGYNSFTVSSLTVSANMATVTTSTDHGLSINDNIVLSGANQSVFNSRFTVTDVISTTQFKFPIATSTTPATGTITGKIPALGWSLVYSGTNQAVYRAPSGNRFYLQVDDTNDNYMSVRMFETMISVSSGVGGSSTVYWQKSDVADSSARSWFIIGGDRGFYFTSAWFSTEPLLHYVSGFGDFVSYKDTDIYNTLLIGTESSSIPVFGRNQGFTFLNAHPTVNAEVNYGQRLMRNFSGLINSPKFHKNANVQAGFSNTYIDGVGTYAQMGFNLVIFPSQTTNGITLKPVDIQELGIEYKIITRGILPGVYVSCESSGTGVLSDIRIPIGSKKFIGINVAISSAYRIYTHTILSWSSVF